MKTVYLSGGLRALYKGLPVQLIGIIPEKALKLSVNDVGRSLLVNPDGTISLHNEALAGGLAGLCQVCYFSLHSKKGISLKGTRREIEWMSMTQRNDSSETTPQYVRAPL